MNMIRKPQTNVSGLAQKITLFALLILISGHTVLSARTASLDKAIRPISHPAYFDLPMTQSYLHPIFIYQSLPKNVDTTLGRLPLDGDFQIYALAFEWAINEQFSLLASKDGYIDFNPDATLTKAEGFADLAAGVKWAFLVDESKRLAMSAKLMLEIPTGDDSVWQGNGEGTVVPSFTVLKMHEGWQLTGTVGFMLPLDDEEESSLFYHNWHVSYAVTERCFPLIEINHYHVLDSDGGPAQFGNQVGGAVPAVIRFEGGDLINLGAANAGDNRDLVTLAVGARYRVTDAVDAGIAYELPLTDEEASLMESRVTLDLIWRF